MLLSIITAEVNSKSAVIRITATNARPNFVLCNIGLWCAMKHNKRALAVLKVNIVFIVSLAASAYTTGNFVKIRLPKGVSIDLPRNWVVLSSNQRITLDSAVEAGLDLSRIEQESSNLPFAANYYDNNGRTLGIVNNRYYPNLDLTQHDARQLTRSDLSEFDVALKENMLKSMQASGMSILSWNGTEKVNINGITAFTTEYRRSSLKGSGAFRVRLIRVFASDRSFTLTVSYLESAALLLRPVADRIISSIRLTDIDSLQSENTRTKTKTTNDYSLISQLYGDNWALTLIISALLTWGVGLAPPLLIRFAFLRRSMAKGWAIGTVVLFGLMNIVLFTALGSTSKTHGALILVGWASYAILRKGEKKQTKKTVPAPRQKTIQEEVNVNKTKIRFECPSCGSKYAANPNQAGNKGNCKKCGHVIVVPK